MTTSHVTLPSPSEFLTSKGIPVVLQPPYSPELSPCDFFSKLKNVLKGRHFGTIKTSKECNGHAEDHTG